MWIYLSTLSCKLNEKSGFTRKLYILGLLYNIRMVVVVVLLFYVHGKQLRSCRDGQLT